MLFDGGIFCEHSSKCGFRNRAKTRIFQGFRAPGAPFSESTRKMLHIDGVNPGFGAGLGHFSANVGRFFGDNNNINLEIQYFRTPLTWACMCVARVLVHPFVPASWLKSTGDPSEVTFF